MTKEQLYQKRYEAMKELIEAYKELSNPFSLDEDTVINLQNRVASLTEQINHLPDVGTPFDEATYNPLCDQCGYQNSENCNTCDVLNPQFR